MTDVLSHFEPAAREQLKQIVTNRVSQIFVVGIVRPSTPNLFRVQWRCSPGSKSREPTSNWFTI
jgi:hypothetical protein